MTGEGGQSTVEYTGLLTVVAVLFVALVASDLPVPETPSWLAAAMCAAWKGERCASEGQPGSAVGPAARGRAGSSRPAELGLPVAPGGPAGTRPPARPRLPSLADAEAPRAGSAPLNGDALGSLPPAEQRALALRRPELVGGLDGAPATMRYAANRVLMRRAGSRLGGEVARLDGEIAGHRQAIASGNDPLGRAVRLRLALDHRERLVARSRQYRLWAADPGRRFLVFDPRGDGRVAEVVGDLERSPHRAVMVPGTGSDIDNFEEHLAPRARALRAASRRYAGSDVAVIAWLGYDPPDTVPGAALGGRARSGGRALSRLLDALETRGDPHTTVIGHSYGSVTVGNAAAHSRMRADDVVFTGSPGTGGVRRDVAGLGRRSRFWAGETPRDLVAWAPMHGEAPGDPGFGASVFDASGEERPVQHVVHNHQSYYRRGSASLRNLARISGGRPADVTAPPLPRSLLRRWTEAR